MRAHLRVGIAALVVFCVTAPLAVVGAGVLPVWFDESASVLSAMRSLPSLARMAGEVDLVHSAYYVLLHLWFDVVGYTPLTLRLPSAIAVAATAALLVVLVARYASLTTAVAAGLLLLAIPRANWAAVEGRSFALQMLLVVGMTLALCLALDHPPRSRRRSVLAWTAYGVLAVVGTLVFIYVALAVLAHAVTVLALALGRAIPWRRAGGFAITAAAAGIVLLPFAAAAEAQSGQIAWLGWVDNPLERQVFGQQYFVGDTTIASLGWVAMGVGAIALAFTRRGRVLLAGALPLLVVPTVVVIAVTVLATPVYWPRYLTFTTPAIAVLLAGVAGATAELVRRGALRLGAARGISVGLSAAAMVGLVAVAAAVAAPAYLDNRGPTAKLSPPSLAIADTVAATKGRDGVGVVFETDAAHPEGTMATLPTVYPLQFAGTRSLNVRAAFEESPGLYPEVSLVKAADLAGVSTVWLVGSGGAQQVAADRGTILDAGFVVVQTQQIEYVTLERFERAR